MILRDSLQNQRKDHCLCLFPEFLAENTPNKTWEFFYFSPTNSITRLKCIKYFMPQEIAREREGLELKDPQHPTNIEHFLSFEIEPVSFEEMFEVKDEMEEGNEECEEEISEEDQGGGTDSWESSESMSDLSYSEKDNYSPQFLKPKGKMKKIKKKEQGDLKNLIQAVRRCLSKYICRYVPENKAYKEFMEPRNTNLFSYEKLFKDEELEPILRRMFLERYLLRAIQCSRCQLNQKLYYIKKMAIFQRKFVKGGSFTHIK